jgi:uncharacterized protein (TIGR00251 family)
MLLYLKIKPNQRFDTIENIDGLWLVKIKSPAVEGKANEQLIKFMGEILELPKSKIILKKGLTSRFKCLEIEAETEYVNQQLNKASRKLHNTM